MFEQSKGLDTALYNTDGDGVVILGNLTLPIFQSALEVSYQMTTSLARFSSPGSVLWRHRLSHTYSPGWFTFHRDGNYACTQILDKHPDSVTMGSTIYHKTVVIENGGSATIGKWEMAAANVLSCNRSHDTEPGFRKARNHVASIA